MAAAGTKSDKETKEYQLSASSDVDGGFNSTAVLLYGFLAIRFAVCACMSLSRDSRSNAHQIAGVIGTGLFLGLGQLLATTGPLGVLLVFLLVGSVAFAFVILANFVVL